MNSPNINSLSWILDVENKVKYFLSAALKLIVLINDHLDHYNFFVNVDQQLNVE